MDEVDVSEGRHNVADEKRTDEVLSTSQKSSTPGNQGVKYPTFLDRGRKRSRSHLVIARHPLVNQWTVYLLQ